MVVLILEGYIFGKKVNMAVMTIAEPTPSTILKSTQNRRKAQPDGIIDTNLYKN